MRQRLVRGLVAVFAVAGVLAGTVSGPALAGGVSQSGPVAAGFPDVEVPAGGSAIDLLGPVLWSTAGPLTLTGVEVSYVVRGARGVRIAPAEGGGGVCVTPSARRVVCTDPRGLSFEGSSVEAYLPVEVTADRCARAGDRATVAITFSATGLAPITGVSEVRVV